MSFVWWDAWLTLHDVNDTHGPTARLRTCYIDKNMPTYVYIDRYIHTHMHTHTYIQRTSRVATSVLSGRLVLAKVQADQKKRIITGSEYSSPPPSQTRFCRKATPLACKRNTLDKKTSLNISFGTRGSIISQNSEFSANVWFVFANLIEKATHVTIFWNMARNP